MACARLIVRALRLNWRVTLCGGVLLFGVFAVGMSTVIWGSPYSIVEAMRPRPVFEEWMQTDKGARWVRRHIAAAPSGDVLIDRQRNIVLISMRELLQEQRGLWSATLTFDGGITFDVSTTPNQLIMVGRSVQRAALPPQTADCVWSQYGEISRDDLLAGLRNCQFPNDLWTLIDSSLAER